MEPNSLLQQMRWLQSADPSLSYQSPYPQNQAASFDHPHSCAHCQHISINAEEFKEKPRFTEIFYEFGRGLEQAIAASKSGCALFELFLDSLVNSRINLPQTVESLDQIIFGLEFITNEDINEDITCNLVLDVLYGGGETLRLQQNTRVNTWPIVPRLHVCARKDDPASNVIMQRPPESDRFSERSIQFGKDCLATCLKHHERCRTEWLRADLNSEELVTRQLEDVQLPDETIAMDDLPTRLLHIQTAPDNTILVRLLEISDLTTEEQEQVAAAGFAALSYCWGKEGNPVQLTSETCDILKQGIPISKLPATISDAMTYSNNLLLEYIWVDALCIFQDDDQDKDIEIGRMGAYYGANTLTLCAASADGSSKGLRNPDTYSSSVKPALGLPCRVGEVMGQIILHSRFWVREHITERGWTLQESLLSRRILIFSNQLYWCCVDANAECEGPMAQQFEESGPGKPSRAFGLPESLVPGIHPVHVMTGYPPIKQWQRVVKGFTRRYLGVASDKLLAISAFASWVRIKFRGWAPWPDYSYVAGLFISTQVPYHFAEQLLWRPQKTSGCTRPLNYRAPSWSWAAVDGELQFDSVGLWQPERATCVLEGFESQLVCTAAPYGRVNHAVLNLSGCRIEPLQSFLNSQVHIEEESAALEDINEGVYLLPDTPQDGHLIRSALDVSASFSLFLCQIGIRITTDIIDRHSGRVPSQGLILKPVPGKEPNNFQRVGVFNIHLVRQEGETDESAELRKFFDVEGQTITLL